MTAVEAIARLQEEVLSTTEIEDYHDNAVQLCGEAVLMNKERPLSTVHLFWFGASGDTFPFVIDPELKMNNRMPFCKMKEKFPTSLFSQLPCLSRGEAAHRGGLRMGYCEVRGYNDPNNNIFKTAQYLLINEWIGVINTSEGAKVYLMPTCTVSHDLGVTQGSYPQMLHAVFVKKHRESRGHFHRLQLISYSSSSAERPPNEPSSGTSTRQQEEVGVAVGGVQKRRVSFAPIPTTAGPSASPEERVPQPTRSPFRPQAVEEEESEEEVQQIAAVKREEIDTASTTEEEGEKVGYGGSHVDKPQPYTSPMATPPLTTSPSLLGVARESDTRVSPGSEVSEEGSTVSSLSSSASFYESPQAGGRGRGKRGRPRGRGRRGGRGRGAAVAVVSVEKEEESVGRGRGGRGRKRRGRGTRGARGRGRGRGAATEPTSQEELESPTLEPPEPKKTRVSHDLVAEEGETARANNSELYKLLDSQAAPITALQQVQVQMMQMQPQVMVTRQLLSQQRQPQTHLPSISTEEETEREKMAARPLRRPVVISRLPGSEEVAPVDQSDSGCESAGRDAAVTEEEPGDGDLGEEEKGGECEVQVQEEVVAVLSEQDEADQMEVDADPFFQAPKPPPRRVSLLEYKERMREKKKPTSEEQPQRRVSGGNSRKMERNVSPPLTEAGPSEPEPVAKEEVEKDDSQGKDIELPKEKEEGQNATVAVESHILQSVIVNQLEEKKSDSQTQVSEATVSEATVSSSSGKMADSSSVGQANRIEWSEKDTHNKRDTITDEVSSVSSAPVVEKKASAEEAGVSEVETEREGKVMEDRIQGESKEREVLEEQKKVEKKTDKKQEEKERKRQILDKDRRLWKEKERKLALEEREKRAPKKVVKPLESWKPPVSHSEPIPTHPSPFPPAQQRFNIPVHPVPRFHHPHHISLLPSPMAPPPQPAHPQSLLGYPPHPFHQAQPPPPPAPAFHHPPPNPQPPPDVWGMFGNLFAQHNMFPSDDPPAPAPRSPSPHPPVNFGSPHHRSPSPLHFAPPHMTPPGSPRGQKSRSPDPQSRKKSGSLSPATEPKPLDAKQFKIISELIKRTAVKKCDAAVQVVPPRMISEGTQDGRGFRLRNTAVQVGVKTCNRSTLTERGRPQVQHRSIQTSATLKCDTSTQTQPSNRSIAVQTATHDNTNPVVAALETFESLLDTTNPTYPTVDAIVTRVENWLSRRAVGLTDATNMSDYELVDMSGEEEEENDKNDFDSVFVGVKETTLPSPVVSGASNISDGDLSDIISPTPSESDADKTTKPGEGEEREGGREGVEGEINGREKVESEEERKAVVGGGGLYSPSHPLESGGEFDEEEPHLLSLTPAPSSPLAPLLLSDPAIPTFLAPALSPSKGLSPSAGTVSPGEKPVKEDENKSGGLEKMDAEEAILEEHLFLGEPKAPHGSLEVCPPPVSKEKQDEKGCSGGPTSDSTVQEDTTETTEEQSTTPHSGDVKKTSGREGELLSQSTSGQSPGELSSQRSATLDKTRESSSSSEPTTTEKQSPENLGREGERASSSEGSTAGHPTISPRRSARQRASSSEDSTTGRPTISPRRSARQRVSSEKLRASTEQDRCKSRTHNNTDLDESTSSSSQHSYETQQRRQAETEEESREEDRRELHSRHKSSSDDSSCERGESRRELRPRTREGRRDDSAGGETKSRMTREEGKTQTKSASDQGLDSEAGSGRRRGKSKLMVPTLQAFEDESNGGIKLTEEPLDKAAPRMPREKVSRKSSSDLKPKQKAQSERETGQCNETQNEGEDGRKNEGEMKEGFSRSVSLPPFKVVKTSPASSPTERPLPGRALITRSISYSPPGTAVPRKRPSLTKGELLAMVRAKKKVRVGKDLPYPLERSGDIGASGASGAGGGERVGVTVQPQLNINTLVFNFHQHVQTLLAHKASDGGMVQHWRGAPPAPTRPNLPHRPPYSLRNPPPPPPGPPPTSLKPASTAVAESQNPRPAPVEAGLDQTVSEEEPTKLKPSDEEMEVENPPDEETCTEDDLREGIVTDAELKASEETVSIVLQDMAEKVAVERVQIFQGRLLDTLEEKIVLEQVKEAVEVGVQDKVADLICAEDVLQERTLEAVEETISGEVVRAALDEGVEGKVVELIQAECVLQDRVLEALEGRVVHEIVAEMMKKEMAKEIQWLVQAEEIVQEEAARLVEKTIVKETLRGPLDREIVRKAAETVKSEEFLQERAVAVVEDQTVEEAMSEVVQQEVSVGVESILVCEAATAVLEGEVFRELQETVVREAAVEGVVGDVVTTEVLECVMEGCVRDAAREKECQTEEMVARATCKVEEEVSGCVMEECVREAVKERECQTEEMVAKATHKAEEEVSGCVMEECVREAVKERECQTEEMVARATHKAEEEVSGCVMEECVREAVKERVCETEEMVARTTRKVEEEVSGCVMEECVREAVKERECQTEEMVARITCKVEEEVSGCVMEECVREAAREKECQTEEMVARTARKVEEEVSGCVMEECVGIIATEVMREEMVGDVLATVVGSFIDLAADQVASEVWNEELIAETENIVSEQLQCEVFDELQEQVALDLAQKEQARLEETLVDDCLSKLEERLMGEVQSVFARGLMAEALQELEVSVMEKVEDQVMNDILELNLDGIIICDMQIKTLKNLEETVFADLVGEATEAAVENTERVAQAEESVLSLTTEEMLEETQHSLAKERAEKEEGVSMEAEEKISQNLGCELLSIAQDRVAAEVAEEEMFEAMASEILVESLIVDFVDESTSERIESQEKLISQTVDVVSREVEERCVVQAEGAAVNELAVAGKMREVTSGEMEVDEREKVAQGMGERAVDNEPATHVVTEPELKSPTTYNVNQDTLVSPNNTQNTPGHVEVMDSADSSMDSRVEYEVTEVVPDTVSPLRAHKSLAHVHIVDSNESTNEMDSRVHVIDAPQHHTICGEMSSTSVVSQDTTAQVESDKAGELLNPVQAVLEPNSPSPSQTALGSSILKYTSHRFQLRPTKLFSGVRRHTSMEASPSAQHLESGARTLSSGSQTFGGRKYRTRSRVRQRRSSSVAKKVPASSRQLRPRTKSQSALSEAPPTEAMASSPLSAPSPAQLTKLAISSITVLDNPIVRPNSLSPTPQSILQPTKSASRGMSRGRNSPTKSPTGSHPDKVVSLEVKVPRAILRQSLSGVAHKIPSDRSEVAHKVTRDEVVEHGREAMRESPDKDDDVFIADEPPKEANVGPVSQSGVVEQPVTVQTSSVACGEPLASSREEHVCGQVPYLETTAEDGAKGPEEDGSIAGNTGVFVSALGSNSSTPSSELGADCTAGDRDSEVLEAVGATERSVERIPSPLEPFVDGDNLDLSPASLAELESPAVSPATANSSSPAISPCSIEEEEEMILRLEGSFSSAPETDSDQEGDEEDGSAREAKVESGGCWLEPDPQGVEAELGSLNDYASELSVGQKNEAVGTEDVERALIGDTVCAAESATVSAIDSTRSPQHGVHQAETPPLLPSTAPSAPEDTHVSEQTPGPSVHRSDHPAGMNTASHTQPLPSSLPPVNYTLISPSPPLPSSPPPSLVPPLPSLPPPSPSPPLPSSPPPSPSPPLPSSPPPSLVPPLPSLPPPSLVPPLPSLPPPSHSPPLPSSPLPSHIPPLPSLPPPSLIPPLPSLPPPSPSPPLPSSPLPSHSPPLPSSPPPSHSPPLPSSPPPSLIPPLPSSPLPSHSPPLPSSPPPSHSPPLPSSPPPSLIPPLPSSPPPSLIPPLPSLPPPVDHSPSPPLPSSPPPVSGENVNQHSSTSPPPPPAPGKVDLSGRCPPWATMKPSKAEEQMELASDTEICSPMKKDLSKDGPAKVTRVPRHPFLVLLTGKKEDSPAGSIPTSVSDNTNALARQHNLCLQRKSLRSCTSSSPQALPTGTRETTKQPTSSHVRLKETEHERLATGRESSKRHHGSSERKWSPEENEAILSSATDSFLSAPPLTVADKAKYRSKAQSPIPERERSVERGPTSSSRQKFSDDVLPEKVSKTRVSTQGKTTTRGGTDRLWHSFSDSFSYRTGVSPPHSPHSSYAPFAVGHEPAGMRGGGGTLQRPRQHHHSYSHTHPYTPGTPDRSRPFLLPISPPPGALLPSYLYGSPPSVLAPSAPRPPHYAMPHPHQPHPPPLFPPMDNPPPAGRLYPPHFYDARHRYHPPRYDPFF